jgi:hypothetical protein
MAFATSAHTMTPIPVHHADVMVHTGIYVCGPGMTRVFDSCVPKTERYIYASDIIVNGRQGKARKGRSRRAVGAVLRMSVGRLGEPTKMAR